MYCLKSELLPNKDRAFFTPYTHIKLKESSCIAPRYTRASSVCCEQATAWWRNPHAAAQTLELTENERQGDNAHTPLPNYRLRAGASRAMGSQGIWAGCCVAMGRSTANSQYCRLLPTPPTNIPHQQTKQNIQQPSTNKHAQIPLVFNCSL